jgi:hypothetical protein
MASAMPLAAHAAVSANVSGSYANFSNGGGDVWNVDGALSDTFSSQWGGEVSGGYHNSAGDSGGNFGGALFWFDPSFRVAASGNYLSLGGAHISNYGVGGEWFASSQFTVALRGGGISANSGTSGGYVGGDVKFYFTPNIAVNGGVDYVDFSGLSLTSEDVKAEWLISQSFPVSIFGGYSHIDANGGGNEDAFFVGIKIYTNDPAGGALVDRQRGGNLGYIDGMPYLGSVL